MKNIKLIKIILAFFLCVFYVQILFAQNNKSLDSLKYLLKTAKHDTTKIRIRYEIGELTLILRTGYYDSIRNDCEKILKKNQNKEVNITIKKYLASSLNDIGYIYQDHGNIPKSLENYYKCLKISEEIRDKYGISTSLNNIGSIYKNQGNIPKTIEYYEKSLKIRIEINDKYGISNSLNNIGLLYQNQGDIPKALEYFHKCLKISEEIRDKNVIAISLNNIGNVYYQMEDTREALKYYQKGLKISEEIRNKQNIANSLNNIGLFYKNQNDISKALECFIKSLNINEEIGDKQRIAVLLINIGNIYLNQDNIPKALEYFNKSLKISEEIENKEYIANSLVEIGGVYLYKDEILNAKTYAIKALTIANELDFPYNIERSAELLYNIYLKEGNYKQALEYYKLEIKMHYNIVNDENFKNTQKQKAKYEYEKKAAVDSIAYNKAIEIKNLKIVNQKVIIYSFVGGFIILLILLIIIIYQRNKLDKQKKQLENRQIILDYENTQLKIKNVEIENQQLKQQIHPHFLFNSLNTLQMLLYKNPEIAEKYIKNLSNFLRVSISSSNVNLVTIKEEIMFCLSYLEMQKIRFNDALLYSIDISENIQESGSVPVFSIQQLLENSIKHNNFSTKKPLNIKIFQEYDRITVTNNLQEQLTTIASTGVGLKNISERYKILSGDDIIINKTDNEFSVSIKIINN